MKARSGKKKFKKVNRLDCTNRSLSARPSKGKKGRKLNKTPKKIGVP